ncbi:DUF397 domain-containing protein [Streptosporangium sp. NPDC000509]|uniref:DUF397 domain-containing protein n=1 Tax=Streptosporangium sp. NPDC000509 TaxID=3366186 RepID=UPI0036763095
MIAPDLSLAKWRKSSRSGGNGQCVEVAGNLVGIVAVRDSKNPNGPALIFSPGDWRGFVNGIKDGEFDNLI